MNNGYKKLIENYKEDLKACEEKNLKNIDLITTIQNEKKEIETKIISLTQNIKIVSEENKKLKTDIEILKNQKKSSIEQLIISLKKDIDEKNKEIEQIKNNIPDPNIIIKLNEVIEKQNNEFKLLENKYKLEHEENEKLKLENIELQVEINQLIKSDYETEYSSNYESDEESEEDIVNEETTEIKNKNKEIFGFKQRKFRQATQDFFDNLLLEQQNKENKKEVTIKEPDNFTYSTDYHVEMLQNSNKLKPIEERKYYKDKMENKKEILKQNYISVENVNQPTIRLQEEIKEELPNTINNEMNIIINNKEDKNKIFIEPKEHKNPILGGAKKDRFTIHEHHLHTY